MQSVPHLLWDRLLAPNMPVMTKPQRSGSTPAAADRLFPRCLFCRCAFSRSALSDQIPPGTRLAYDPLRGRVWSICERCTRWNLIPLADRYDTVDVLEHALRDEGCIRAASAHIALYDVADLSVIRISGAPLLERLSWRYAHRLIERHSSYQRQRTRMTTTVFNAVARAGELFGAWQLDRDWGPSGAADILRWQRFGSTAWTGRTPCPFCGSVLHTVYFDTSWWLYPRVEHGRLVIGVPCTRCDPWTPRNVFDVTGQEAQQLLLRALAYHHVAGATQREVGHAAKLIERAGSAERLIRDVATGRSTLWGLGRTRSVALEIAATHVTERDQLEQTLPALEAEWRLEEATARIIDEELS